jgi:hypothetical protein
MRSVIRHGCLARRRQFNSGEGHVREALNYTKELEPRIFLMVA